MPASSVIPEPPTTIKRARKEIPTDKNQPYQHSVQQADLLIGGRPAEPAHRAHDGINQEPEEYIRTEERYACTAKTKTLHTVPNKDNLHRVTHQFTPEERSGARP